MTHNVRVKRAYIIINPVAGDNDPPIRLMQEHLKACDVEPIFRVTNSEDDTFRFAEEAVQADDVDAVVVHGGDGTVMQVASVLCHADKPLAILPGGTQNIIASALNISDDLSEAITLAFKGQNRVKQVDMGQLNGDPFLIRVGIGWEAQISTRTNRETKKRWHQFAYQVSSVQALRDIEPVTYQLTLDGETVEVEGINCTVCNIGNIGLRHVEFAPGITPDDGLLDVIIIPNKSLKSLTDFLQSAAASTNVPVPWEEALPHWQASSIQIEVEKERAVTKDGQPVDVGRKMTIEAMHQAVRIIVPSETTND